LARKNGTPPELSTATENCLPRLALSASPRRDQDNDIPSSFDLPKTIDLWPYKYLEKPENNPALTSRIAKHRKEGIISDTAVPAFHQQVIPRFSGYEWNVLPRKMGTDSLFVT
jgi:hypothetical protein